MNGVKRVTVRRSAEEWRAIVSRFERSGKTSKQFCSAEQLTPSTIALWRRRLRGQAAGSGANGAVRGVGGFAAGAGGVGGGAGLGRRRGFSFAAPVAVLNFGGDCRIWLCPWPSHLRTTEPFLPSTRALSLLCRARDLVKVPTCSFVNSAATRWLMYSEPLSAWKPLILKGKDPSSA